MRRIVAIVTSSLRLLDESILLERLGYGHREGRRHLFLVGSPLVAPEAPEKPGVPGVSAMIRRVGEVLGRELDGLGYQEAFQKLNDVRSPEAVEKAVREAVLAACEPAAAEAADGELLRRVRDGEPPACRALENRTEVWHLRPGVEALGALCALHPGTFGGRILTTNFDPLIQVAVERAGGRSLSTVLHGDGRFTNSWGSGAASQVIHVHGYWHGNDSLHSPRQLTAARPQLEAELTRELRDAVLVVVAYGGWDDVLTRTLEKVAADDGTRPEILWTFYGDDPSRIEESHGKLLSALRPAIDRGRATFFGGIDCHRFFPALLREVAKPEDLEALERRAARPADKTGPTLRRGLAFSLPGGDFSKAAGAPGSRDDSPFRPGLPIASDENLFGRDRERRQLEDALRRGGSVQILGERRMGKTSLLRWVERHALDFQDRPAVRLDAQGLVGRSPARLVTALAEALGEGSEGDLEPGERLARLPPTLLLVDEAENLLRPDRGFGGDFFELLRSLGQEGRHVWVSTSRASLPEQITEVGLTSSFLNDAITVPVGQLDAGAARELLGQGDRVDRGLDEERVEMALREAAGFAHGLQWLGEQLWRAHLSPEDTPDAYDLAVEPFFRAWWRHRDSVERDLLKRCAAETDVTMEDLPEHRLRVAALRQRGLMTRTEVGGRSLLSLPGAGWRRYVQRA